MTTPSNQPSEPSERELLLRVAKCPADVRAWAEAEGFANMKEHVDSAAVMASQAATTLTVLLAGLGGSLAFAVKVFEPSPGAVAWGAAALCGYLAVLSAVLVLRNISLEVAQMQHNQPGSLLLPNATLEQLRMGELVNLELRIRHQTAFNNRRAAALNQVRWAVIASPLVFAAAAALAKML